MANREILFRGKRTDDGKWVYGHYIKATHHWHSYGVHEDWIATDTVQNGGWCNVRGKYAVLPETVGQYTGLTDKNGKKIFEGDIVEGHCHSQWSHRLQRCVVEYDRDGFLARHYVVQGGVERFFSYKVLFSKDVVLIGNIHDNPELMKGGAE